MDNQYLELLDANKHQSLKLTRGDFSDLMFAVNTAVVVPGELDQLVHEYPIFITRSPQSEQFQLSVLFGFESGQNLYLNGAKWHANFLPLDIVRRPFQLITPQDGLEQNGILGFDTRSTIISETASDPLFNSDGTETAVLSRIQKAFVALMEGKKQVDEMLNFADQEGLIDAVKLEYQFKGESFIREGVYRLSPDKISRLAAPLIQRAHHLGLLRVHYLMQASNIHIDKLLNAAHRVN